MFSQLTELKAQYVKIGENTNQYTADATTNHIFTMTKTGGNYNAITINVSLNKAAFNTPSGQVGWGTGNAIPGDWDFEITNISVNPSAISNDKKSFTFSGNPPQNATVTLRIFDGNGTLNGLGSTSLTYRLESIFTETLLTVVPCTGELKIVVNEVVVGASKPCAGTAGDPKYNIKVYELNTTNLVTEKTQSSNEFILDLPIGGYDYVITDGCGRTHTSFTNISDKPEFGANVIFSGKECSTDATAKAVLRLTGAKRPITWVLEKKNGDNWDLIYNNTNAGASASSTSDIDVIGDGAFTITLSNIAENGDYRFNFTDANLCTNSALFTVSSPSDLSHNLVDMAVATKEDLNCNGDVDGKLTFTGSGGWTQPFVGNNINPVNWGSGYTFTLINADTGDEVGVVTSNSWFNYAKNNANEQIGWEATFDNLPAGNYKLKLKESVAVNSDANPDVFFGCEVLFNNIYTIAAPPELVIDGNKTDISCFGAADGSIDLSVAGGTTNYTYSWTTANGSGLVATDQDQSGLGPGTYNVTVTDAKNCTQSTSFTITQPAQLAIELDNSVATAIDCFDNNGVIKADITVSSSPPFTYVLSGTDYNGNNVNISSGAKNELTHSFSVKAGTYEVKVTDSNNCSVTTAQRTLTQPADGLTVTGEVSADFDGTENGGTAFDNGDGLHMTCNGGTNGQITLNVSGSTAPYTYSWTAISGSGLVATDKDQSGLTAGVYDVVISDSKGCSVSRRYVVSDPAPLTIPSNDMANAEKPNYTYLGELGTSKYYLSSTSLTYMEARDLAANLGGYLVSIKTEAENQWLIDNSPDQNFWLGLDDIRNESKVGGNVDKTKYRWNDGTGLAWENFGPGEPNDNQKNTTTNHPGEDYIEFSNGTWNDIYHDVKRKFVIEYNPTQIPDFNGNSIKCNGDTNGSIDFIVTGGTSPYTYSWTTANGSGLDANSKSQSGLGAGTYSVTVTDQSGCTKSISYTLTEPDELQIAFDDTVDSSIACFDNNGTLKVDINQGSTAPYTYLLEGTDYLGNAVSQSLTNQNALTQTYDSLKSGTYKVTITDANGCVKVTPNKTLTQPAAGLSITETLSTHNGFNITCNGANDGSIDVTVAGGTLGGAAYTYSWTTADGSGLDASAEDQTGLGPGTYKVEVTDSNSCKIEKSYTITEPTALAISETISSHNGFNITCNGANDGSIDLLVSGGTSVYTYNWTTLDGSGLVADDEDQTGLGQGTYKVVVTDQNSCSIEKSFTLTEPTALGLTETISLKNGFNITCKGANDGSIDVNVTGGTSVYTYTWTTADGSGLDATAEDQTGLGPGTYKVVATDQNSCSIEKTFTLTEPANGISVTETISSHNGFNITCNGANDGAIDVTVTGGTTVFTYEWTTADGSGLDATAQDQTGLGPGTYKFVVTDSNDCKVEKNYIITEPAALAINETISSHTGFNITCNGANDGSIDLSVTGGTSVYTYNWTTVDGTGLVANDEDQTGLGPGTYKVIVTDQNSCSIEKSFTLTEPNPLSLTQTTSDFNGFDASCSGGIDAEIDINVSGGAPQYFYNWTTADGSGLDATAQDQTGLSAGTYNVEVTDSNGCKISQSFVITEPPPIILTSTLSDFNGFNISCNGQNDGSIDITVSGGRISGGDIDYTYEWTTLNGSGLDPNVADQSGLTAGTYTIKITDSNNCTLTRSIDIVQPDVIDFTGVLSDYNGYNVSVNGGSDGFININPSGGSAGYIYEWSTADGSGLVNGQEDQTGLSIGTYTLKMTDTNGCNITKSFTLDQPTELTIDLGNEPTNILCFGEKTGEIKAIITQESVPAYKYTLNGTDYTGTVVSETVSSITALSYTFLVRAGTYTITVEDLNGGQKTTQPRIYTQPAGPLTISDVVSDFNGFNISCNGASDGSIDLTVLGGTISGPSYSYTWTTNDGSGMQPNTQDQSGLGPGTYTVVVEDENACKITKTYIITEPELIDYKLDDKKDISCFGANDGSIDITVTKGTGVYTFTWTTTNGAGLDPIAEDQSGLSPGKYKLVLSDGCQTLQYIYEITEPDVLKINLDQKVDILCNGDTTGQIDVTVSGGTSPYTYEWVDNFGNKYNRDVGNVFNTGNLSNIPAGVYDLKVTDSNGCQETLQVEIKQPDELKIDFNKVDVSCFNGSDGTIDVTASGGVAPYTFTWSDFGNGASRTNLSAGKYTVTVTDKNNCQKSVEIEIQSAPQFNVSSVVTPISCFGANDGSIELTVVGGQAPVTLTWADDPQAGTKRTNLKSGVYSVLLKDSSGCEINEIYTISEPAKLQLSAIKTDAIDCANPNSGSIDLQVVGGNPPYTYIWSNGAVTEDLVDLPANNYTVTVVDANGCNIQETYSIVRPADINVDLTTSLRVVCETRDVYQVNKLSITGGVFPYTIKWSDGSVSGSNGEIMETNKEGSYSVEVTDNNGCSKTLQIDVALPKIGYPEFDYTSFYWQTFNALTFNDPITFTNNSTENYLSVSWDFGDGNSSNENDPVHTYAKEGSYVVTLYVTYLSGCVYEIKKTLYVGDSYEIEIPNAFTPNSDNINDTFRPVYYGFKTVELKVFDTWGSLIYSETAQGATMKGWNGNIMGKPASNGNYIYQVSGEAYNGETILRNGPLTLLR